MGKLSPAFKSGSKQLIDNYKPISLLPVCSKTFEKYIQYQFTSLMEEYVNTSLAFLKNWDSLHTMPSSHYNAWSYNKKKHKNIAAYRKSV